MTRDEVIAMAVEAGLIRVGDGWTEPHRWGLAELEAFAKLVAATEREECAKLCDGYTGPDYDTVSDILADAIRARGNHD